MGSPVVETAGQLDTGTPFGKVQPVTGDLQVHTEPCSETRRVLTAWKLRLIAVEPSSVWQGWG